MPGEVTLIVDGKDGEKDKVRAALLEDNVVRSFHFPARGAAVGDLYLARGTGTRYGGIGRFMDLGGGEAGFLPRDKMSAHPILQPGGLTLVQVEREAHRGKPVGLTQQIQIVGKLLIYLPCGDYIGISHRIKDTGLVRRLREKIADWRVPGEGIILRTAAQGMSDERFLCALKEGRLRWQQVTVAARALNHPGRVYRPFTFVASVLNENHWPPAVVYSNVPIQTQALPSCVRVIYEDGRNLFATHGVEPAYAEALRSVVSLPGGASLVIDYAEALTAIDVNSGSVKAGNGWERTVMTINLQAAHQIARQLRLRGIGGMVVIDFLRQEHLPDRRRVLATLSEAMADDPMTVELFGYTRMGLVELTRKHRRSGLMDRANDSR
ncbi:MAG: ribonuclease E/G [Sporolactobacillus sp.]|jgi:ribonuclease G|nr:ribonuclease E/G [Sporolactobacillus sp.]